MQTDEGFFLQLRKCILAAVITQITEGAAHIVDLTVDVMHMIHQIVDRAGNRVWHVVCHTISVEADFGCHRLTAVFFVGSRFADNPPRNTHHGD